MKLYLRTVSIGAALLLSLPAKSTSTEHSISYIRNTEGRIKAITGPRPENQTGYEYDANGNITSTTNALGHAVRFLDFDEQGNPQIIINENGLKTLLTYDTEGNVVFVDDGNRKTHITYEKGEISELTIENGLSLIISRDNRGNLSSIIVNNGEKIDYSFDSSGNPESETILNTNGDTVFTKRWSYDDLNRLVAIVSGDGSVTRYKHDSLQNSITTITPKNEKEQSTYDEFDRPITHTNSLGEKIIYSYNPSGGISEIASPNGSKTTFIRDAWGHVTETIDSDTGVTKVKRDAGGNIVEKTTNAGYVIHYNYDNLDRLTSRKVDNSDSHDVYTYDKKTDQNKGIGFLFSAENETTKVEFSYSDQSSISSRSDSATVNGHELTSVTNYTYDSTHSVIKETHSDEINAIYARDSQGRITSIVLEINGVKHTLVNDVEFLPVGPLKSLTWGNNLTLTREHDKNYKIKNQSMGNWKDSYEYDANGNLTISDSRILGIARFDYDSMDRLVQESNASLSRDIELDPNGNRTKAKTLNLQDNEIVKNEAITYSYSDNTNRLRSINDKLVSIDSNGNITSYGDLSLVYDAHNRLTRIDNSTLGSTTYSYNALDERTVKASTSHMTHFIYNTEQKLAQEVLYNASGTKLQSQHYFWIENFLAGGVIISYRPDGAIKNHQIFYIHNDHLQTPRFATNSVGNIIWQWRSDAFGNAPSKGELKLNLRLPGQYYDEESGLHYNYFRDYDPKTGRYMQSDPLGAAAGPNSYNYAEGNPLKWVDPFGLASSGVPQKVSGTNLTVRVDPPHVPGQQSHAHISQKGKPDIVINKDGSGSHGSNPEKLSKNKKLLEFLRAKGFKLGLPFFWPSYNDVMSDYCSRHPYDDYCLTQSNECR